MNGNGRAINSFSDVEDEFRKRDVQRADDYGETMQAIGQLAGEVGNLTKAQDELRRVIIERLPPTIGPMPPMRRELPSGVHDLAEAAMALRQAGHDRGNPMTSDRARAIIDARVEELRILASASRWDRFVGLLPYIGRETLKVATGAIVTATLAYVWYLLHK